MQLSLGVGVQRRFAGPGFLFLPLSLTCMVCLTFDKNPLRCLSFHPAFPKTYYRAVRLLQIVQLFQIGELWRYLGCLYHGFLLLVENRKKDQHTRNKYYLLRDSIVLRFLRFQYFFIFLICLENIGSMFVIPLITRNISINWQTIWLPI